MKQFIYILLIAVSLQIQLSCKKDFLNNPVNTSLLQEEYVINLQTTGEYMGGVYLTTSSFMSLPRTMIYPDLVADNVKPVTPATANLLLHYNWQQQADANATSGINNLNPMMYTAYQIILSCNLVIEKATEYRNQDVAKADKMKGEALTIRALIHFLLVNNFAQSYNFTPGGSHPGVAYITSSYWGDPDRKRNTVAEVYQQIIADLQSAVSLLSSVEPNTTLIINRYTAKAILSRVYLFKEDYTAAKNLAREVAQKFPLLKITDGYPDGLFKFRTPSTTEVLYQLVPGNSVSLGIRGSFSGQAGIYYKANKAFTATNDIAGIITESATDVRRTWVTSAVGGIWNITKFPSGVVADVTPADASYFPVVVRSTEMFLTAAESYAKLNNEDSARYFLDAVRKRADVAAINTTAAGTVLIDIIQKEKRKEFAFEGMRMFDLLRWKKGVTRTDPSNGGPTTLSYRSDKAIAPIPLKDVMNGFQQNLGYSSQ